MRRAYRVFLGMALALTLAGCSAASPEARPAAGQAGPAASVPTLQRPQGGAGEAGAARPTIQRPQGGGPGPAGGGPGQGVTVAVSEEQMNLALGAVLGVAQDAPVESLSVDLRPGVVGVSASALVEGRSITIDLGLAPTVQDCALSLTVAEQPAKPDGIPAPVWDALVEQIVTAVESVVVTPQNACVKAAEVSDTQLSLTIGSPGD